MIGKSTSTDQGRARSLYDEQLQRQQQEKLLWRTARVAAAAAEVADSEQRADA